MPRSLVGLVVFLGVLPLAVSVGHGAEGAGDATVAVEPLATVADHAIVPGFDRFFTAEDADHVAGGRLLLGELNCAACHRVGEAVAAQIDTKQAPLLGEVGARVNPDYLRAFIADPQTTKPGTTMPSLLAAVAPAERAKVVEPLVHFLVAQSRAKFRLTAPRGDAVARGGELFHKAGCVACHAPQRDRTADLLRSSVPLGKLESKYSIDSLAAFLLDPLRVRVSGRMPNLVLTAEEARDIANYLLRDTDVPAKLNYAYYEGNWGDLPDFAKLEPKATGRTHEFGVGVKRRNNNFALKFDGFLDIEREGEYTFFTTSDDGSALFVDGRLVVNNDGTHPSQTREGKVKLSAGTYPITVTYFQGGGHVSLKVEYQGPGFGRRLIPDGLLRATKVPPPEVKPFVIDKTLAEKGRDLFGRLGCASCHQLGGDRPPISSAVTALGLAQLNPKQGCLGSEAVKGQPRYQLSPAQKTALRAVITAQKDGQPRQLTTEERVTQMLIRLNCYACHERDKVGGVPRERNEYFTANQADLGDEGRLPPLLTGVGDKLNADWLVAVLTKAGTARPYMDAHMPQFGEKNLGQLASWLVEVDLVQDTLPETKDPPQVAKAAGRTLVGKGGLTCISCHTFNRHQSLGIQATDLAQMTQRLRKDWFHRYMLNPQPFRPGTRMPAAWPNGKSFKPDILDGDASRQILAVWEYLSDGRKAIRPAGLTRQTMELIVGGEALIYRNFIQGAGPRGIAVGHPEQVNLAFDANDQRLALIWQGRFIDASKHWTGRGQGFQSPLGKKVIGLVGGAPFAVLESLESSWPKESGKKAGYRFRGYRLDKLRRPTFHYRFGDIDIKDYAVGLEEGGMPEGLVRSITLASDEPVPNLWFRAAAGGKIEPIDETTFRIDDQLVMRFRLPSGAKPVLRQGEGGPELIVPVKLDGSSVQFVQEFHW